MLSSMLDDKIFDIIIIKVSQTSIPQVSINAENIILRNRII